MRMPVTTTRCAVSGARGRHSPVDRGADVLSAHGNGGRDAAGRPRRGYADVDEVRIVGLVESDWPERTRRSIFYPASLLGQLGWPERDRSAPQRRARDFNDLLRLAAAASPSPPSRSKTTRLFRRRRSCEEIETSGLVVQP